MQRGDGPLEAAARYRAGEGCEHGSKGSQARAEDMMAAGATVRVVRKARRRLEPAVETPRFSFVFPDAVVAQKVAGTGYRSLLEGRYRRMVKIDAAGRRRDELADREAMRSELTEESCLRRQTDICVFSHCHDCHDFY